MFLWVVSQVDHELVPDIDHLIKTRQSGLDVFHHEKHRAHIVIATSCIDMLRTNLQRGAVNLSVGITLVHIRGVAFGVVRRGRERGDSVRRNRDRWNQRNSFGQGKQGKRGGR